MPTSKLTDRAELNAQPANGDLLHIVDIDDTTGSPSGTSKKITVTNLLAGAGGGGLSTIAVRNNSGGTIAKGKAVYITGVISGTPTVSLASNASSSTMPAVGIVTADIANNTDGTIVGYGEIENLDTSGFNPSDTLYVSTLGNLTSTRPTGTALVQNIGTCLKVSASTGSILVQGAGRSNDVPNIPDGQAWIGNASGLATPTTLSNLATSETIQVNTTGTGSAGGFGEGSRVWRDGTTAVSAGACYARGSSGWVVSNAASVATASTGLLAVASAANSGTGMVLEGVVQVAVDPGGSAGDVIYLSLSTGRFSTTPVGGQNEVSRVCGYKVGTNLIYFRPSQDWIEIS